MSKLKKAIFGSGSDSISSEKEIAEFIKKEAFILDVRTFYEAKKGIVPGAINIPLWKLRLKRHLNELPRNKTIVTYCVTGERAGKAKDILETAGFKVINGGSYVGILESKGKK